MTYLPGVHKGGDGAMPRAVSQPVQRWPGGFAELPAGQLYVRTAPAAQDGAEPALLIHGLGGSSTNWTDLMDLLSGTAAGALACSAVDLPGFGYSPPPANSDYRISAHAESVIELLDHQGQWPVHLIGNSMGGAVCIRVAAARPDLVRTITLVSPALPDLRPRLLPMRLMVVTTPGVGPRLTSRLRAIPAELRTDRSFKELYYDPGLVHPIRRIEEIAELRRRDDLPHANEALIASARGLVSEYFRAGPKTLWRDAARIAAPALILHGSHDRLVSPMMAAKAARTFRHARVSVLTGVGHVAMMERPAVVAAEIRAFLDRLHTAAADHAAVQVTAEVISAEQAARA
jgi:pimeloyl-ACP methyl ester carboxylesterase